MARKTGARGKRGAQIRIIGGQWRGRRLPVAAHDQLRPTPDRVRETLFNWLAPGIEGARCLDAFAGTGALGLEAASRGAREVVFVERDRALAAALRGHIERLSAPAHVECMDFARYAANATARALAPFDVVFLDPPFNAALHAGALAQLPALLAPGHRVYLEYPDPAAPQLPVGWSWHRSARAGGVGYGLATWSAPG